MDFSIKCETLSRLSKVCCNINPLGCPDIREKINTIRIQNLSGKCVAVVTNEIIGVVEFLNFTDQPDGHVDIVLTDELMKQCDVEKGFDSKVHINSTPDLAIATLKTDLGYQMNENASYWFDDSPLDNWKNWFPRIPVIENQGFMCWDSYHVKTLFDSSPSGSVVFPEFINSMEPIVLRDSKSSNWVGIFMPFSENLDVKPSKLPDWW